MVLGARHCLGTFMGELALHRRLLRLGTIATDCLLYARNRIHLIWPSGWFQLWLRPDRKLLHLRPDRLLLWPSPLLLSRPVGQREPFLQPYGGGESNGSGQRSSRH